MKFAATYPESMGRPAAPAHQPTYAELTGRESRLMLEQDQLRRQPLRSGGPHACRGRKPHTMRPASWPCLRSTRSAHAVARCLAPELCSQTQLVCVAAALTTRGCRSWRPGIKPILPPVGELADVPWQTLERAKKLKTRSRSPLPREQQLWLKRFVKLGC